MGTGCPTAPSSSYTGNLCVNLANGSNLIMDKNFTINGGFGISNSGNSTFTLPTGRTLNVTGNMGDDANNNATYVINGNLNVGGTVYGKNSNAFSGSGTVTAGGLDFKAEPTCSPCTIDWNIPPGQCQPSPSPFCTIVTPVTLIFFEAKTYPEYVQLNWATATELNFDRFVIEKTRDAEEFIEIGSVQGAGVSTSRIDYSFKDEQVMLGRTYYRLKAIDFDGYTEYFGLATARYEGAKEIVVFPNPSTSGNVNLYLNYFSEEPLYCTVTDLSGAVVYSGVIHNSGFNNKYTIDKALASGMYFLTAKSREETKSIRFVVH